MLCPRDLLQTVETAQANDEAFPPTAPTLDQAGCHRHASISVSLVIFLNICCVSTTAAEVRSLCINASTDEVMSPEYTTAVVVSP